MTRLCSSSFLQCSLNTPFFLFLFSLNDVRWRNTATSCWRSLTSAVWSACAACSSGRLRTPTAASVTATVTACWSACSARWRSPVSATPVSLWRSSTGELDCVYESGCVCVNSFFGYCGIVVFLWSIILRNLFSFCCVYTLIPIVHVPHSLQIPVLLREPLPDHSRALHLWSDRADQRAERSRWCWGSRLVFRRGGSLPQHSG